MVMFTKAKNHLMSFNIAIVILITIFKSNYYVTLSLGILLLCIALYTVIYMSKLTINNDFYFQVIPVILCMMFIENLSLNYISFSDDSASVYMYLIVCSIFISLLVGIKCRLQKHDKYILSTISVFIFVIVYAIYSVNILNFALSSQEPYTVEYMLLESVDKYDADHPTSISTETFRVDALNDNCDVDISEIKVKQSLDVKNSDTIVVEIRKGLFEVVYRVLGKTEDMCGTTSYEKTNE